MFSLVCRDCVPRHVTILAAPTVLIMRRLVHIMHARLRPQINTDLKHVFQVVISLNIRAFRRRIVLTTMIVIMFIHVRG